MNLAVRRAVESDASQVVALMTQFEAYLRDLGDSTDYQFTQETYRRDGFGSDPAFSGVVAESDAGLAGYLLYHFGYDIDSATRSLYVIDVYVAEDHRRQGVGKAMMLYAQRICREAGGKQMVWSVYKRNRSAHRFYEQLGGTYIDDEDYMYLEVSITDGKTEGERRP